MNIKLFLSLVFLAVFIPLPVSADRDTQLEIANTKPLVYPIVSPRISSNFGKRKHPISKAIRHHQGIDLAVPKGAHVRAVQKGQVVWAGSYKGYGKLITIKHGDQTFSLYGHLSEINVETGQLVPAGKMIGRVGSTGNSTGNHLHFEWRLAGKAINPKKVLPGIASKPQG